MLSNRSQGSRDQLKIVMVMGLPRSGTTWLGKIFDSHPDTFYSHEPDSARRFQDVPLLVPVASEPEYRSRLTTQVRDLQDVRAIRVVGKMPLFDKSYARPWPSSVRSAAFVLLKAAGRVLKEPTAPRFLTRSPDDASAWVWKSIESTGRLGVLARAFPDAKIVFLIRHPCGSVASLLRGHATTQFADAPTSEDFGFFEKLAETEQAKSRGLTLDAFRNITPLERVAWRWALLNEKTMQDIDGLANCRTVRYEDLCAEPEPVSRELFAFADLEWHAQSHRFLHASTSQTKQAYYSVFKDPLESAFKWKKQLDPGAIDTILRTVADSLPGRLYPEA